MANIRMQGISKSFDHGVVALEDFDLDVKDGEFVTLFYATIDSKEKTITYCNCGHEPAVLIRNGNATDLQTGGLVLGIDPNTEYIVETVALKEKVSAILKQKDEFKRLYEEAEQRVKELSEKQPAEQKTIRLSKIIEDPF